MHDDIKRLITSIEFEEKEQVQRFRLDEKHTLRTLKAEGLALHPLTVTRKNFGYADYPEISFRINYPAETNQFRDGAAIECFYAGEEPVKGILISFEGKSGEFRLFTPDFPDWIEERGVGIKLAPDTRTTTIMKKAVREVENDRRVLQWFEELHTNAKSVQQLPPSKYFSNASLNESQNQAVNAIIANENIVVLHGPPGTGKTTTLVEAIYRLVQQGEKVLVAAPSNTAVDHISRGLILRGISLLRVGNTSKVDEAVFPYTPEGKLANSKTQKDIRQLKKRADEFRRMALKYKRSFGKAEREQRNLLFKEVRSIREEIKKLEAYHEEKLFDEAKVISGTPIGLYDAGLHKLEFKTLVIDEAGQCIEPLAWCIIPLADKLVLAGDHWQLPPTVLSREAAKNGLNISILERAIEHVAGVFLLDTQYRMRPMIAGFSSMYFYDGLLKTVSGLLDENVHIVFIDTAGSGNHEKHGPDGFSLQNEGELDLVGQLMEEYKLHESETALISPYAGQVAVAREKFPAMARISTIDSFQGQEMNTVIVSLVRSNDEGEIGFLKDYRRMNVAMTRAKQLLIIIGDSATIGADPFYSKMLEYIDSKGGYRTIWEFSLP